MLISDWSSDVCSSDLFSPRRIDRMAGHRPFSDLMKDWSPERRARNEAHKAKLEAELMGRAATRDAIEELEAGKGVRFTSVEALLSDIHSSEERRVGKECVSKYRARWSPRL